MWFSCTPLHAMRFVAPIAVRFHFVVVFEFKNFHRISDDEKRRKRNDGRHHLHINFRRKRVKQLDAGQQQQQ